MLDTGTATKTLPPTNGERSIKGAQELIKLLEQTSKLQMTKQEGEDLINSTFQRIYDDKELVASMLALEETLNQLMQWLRVAAIKDQIGKLLKKH